jgi:translation initiation factor IF-3
MAQNKGLDLVEVAPDGVPPVCRIMNFGKFKYSQRKRDKEASKKQRVIKVKEVKIRPKIDEHDYQIKVRQAWNFLDHGDKVKVTLVFRGREMSHKDIGRMLMERVVSELAEIADPDSPPKDEGPVIVAVFTAKPHRPQGEKEVKNAQA